MRRWLQNFAESATRVKTIAMVKAEGKTGDTPPPTSDAPANLVDRVYTPTTRAAQKREYEEYQTLTEAGTDSDRAPMNGKMNCARPVLPRVLSRFDLIAYGVGSTVGAGVFVITGVVAADNAGPSLVLSFLASAIACLFSGLCYCEFATRVPVAGSAYTYAYATLGELVAWIVGWNLTLEYGISASAVARGWSGYVAAAFKSFGHPLPAYLTEWDIGITHASPLSVLIVAACTTLLCFGVKSSAKFNLMITVVNITLILFVIAYGSTFTEKQNWDDFFPYGVSGTLAGAAKVFFSYIGFDTVSGLAEEVKNPQRDLPIGIAGTLGIAASLYCAVSFVITGMVPYMLINKTAPLSNAFSVHGVHWAADLVALGSVSTLTATTLCSLLGQPRIFMRMAQDGLFFKAFARISAKYETPIFGTVFTGLLSAVLGFALDIEVLTDMISIGTLLAFDVVCAGVLLLRYKRPGAEQKTTRLVVGLLVAVALAATLQQFGVPTGYAFLAQWLVAAPFLLVLHRMPQNPVVDAFRTPFLPLFPATGMIINTYLIFQLNAFALLRLLVWTMIGFSIYVFYGVGHSRLNLETQWLKQASS